MFDHLSTPCRSLVLFGATGDLARRMLWPSLYALHHDGLLPETFKLIGAAHSKYEPAAFAELVRNSVLGSANAAMFDEARFETFIRRVSYVSIDASSDAGMAPLREALSGVDGGTIFYLSTSPHMFGPICRTLGAWGVQWAFGDPRPEELDAGLLVWKIHQRIDRASLDHTGGQIIAVIPA